MAPAVVAAPVEIPRPNEHYVVSAVTLPQPEPPPSVYCSCIEYAKHRVGRQGEVWGWAGSIEPNTVAPSLLDFVLTTEGGGHIAQIIGGENGAWLVIDANYVQCQETIRELPMDSPKIRGYFRP